MKKLKLFTSQIFVTVISLPLATAAQCDPPVIISEAATVCPGGQTSLRTKFIPAATYVWSDGVTGTHVRPAGAGAYTVTVTDGPCTETSDTVVITEKMLPAVIIPSQAPEICPGESITLYSGVVKESWSRESNIPANGRVSAVALSIGSKGFVGTGIFQATSFLYKDWWEYDEASGVWTQKADFPGTARERATGFALNNKAYVGLGRSVGPTYCRDFYEYDPITNSWAAIADFPADVSLASSFTAGGYGYTGLGESGGSNFSDKFYRYDPAADSWTGIADFPGGGLVLAAAFSINDKGYVATGLSSGSMITNDCWQYDPVSNSWNAQPPLPGVDRYISTAFTIRDHAYVVGGFAGLNLPELWEFYNGTWTRRADFPGIAQFSMSAFALHDKAIVLFGSDHNQEVFSYHPGQTVEWPDGSTQETFTISAPATVTAIIRDAGGCTVTPSITVAAADLSAAVVVDGNDSLCDGQKVTLHANGDSWTQMNNFGVADRYATGFALGANGYYLGGAANYRQFWKYDPATDSWSQQANAPMPTVTTVATAWKGKAYVYGNADKYIRVYDPVLNTWEKKAQCPGPTVNVAHGFLLMDHLILPGGLTNTGQAHEQVWDYDLVNNTWTRKNDLPYRLAYQTSFALNGKGYVCTGNSSRGSTSTPQSAVFLQYDPVADSWTDLPDFPGGPRGGGIAFTDGYKAYVGMGNHGVILSDLWQFDPATLSWTEMENIPVGRYATTAFVLANYAYISAGAGNSGLMKDMWRYEMPYNYLWSTGDTTRSIEVDQTGDYSVTVSSNGGCTANSTPVKITVLPLTTVNTPPTDTAVCEGAPVSFAVDADGAEITYQWQYNGTDINNSGIYSGATGSGLSISDASGLNTGLFKCVVTGLCGADTSAEATLTVNALPAKPVIAAGGPTTFCEDNDVSLTSSAASGNAWSTGDNGNSITVSAAGSYTVQVTDGNGCVSQVSDAVTITVNPLPAQPVIATSGPTAFCEGSLVKLTSSANTGNTWSTGATSGSITVFTPGSYTVQATDGNGCVSPVSDAVMVTVNPLPPQPTITPGGPLAFCAGSSVTLTASPAAAWQWSTGQQSNAVSINQSGSYTVQVTDNNGCTSPVSDAVLVQVHPIPSGAITTNGPLANGGIRYMELIAPQLPGAQYKWITGHDEPAIQVTQSGHYRVTVISGAGCYNNFGITVQLIDLTKIPNTFSPNRDGINDYWTIKAINQYTNATVAVFNRNGMKVFEAKGNSISWDGTSNGHELPAGVYYYVLDLKDGGPPVNGWINLLK